MNQVSNKIQLIYAGGTFGCHGTPLAPLPADVFLPELMSQISSHSLTNNALDNIEILDNELIKDSSQLSTIDFFYFFKLILSSYAQGHKAFILITGTDTLSYLGAFLAECFAGSDICIALTASMKPFFDSSDSSIDNDIGNNINSNFNNKLVIDRDSDALANLQLAINTAQQGLSKKLVGVYTCLLGQAWHAQSVQKIHSQDMQAFIGNNDNDYPASSYQDFSSFNVNNDERQAYLNNWLNNKLNQLEQMAIKANHYTLIPIYIVPNQVDTLIYQLESAIKLANKNFDDTQDATTDIVLMGFGAGNVPYDKRLSELLELAHQSAIMVVCTTQCPFGGVSSDYLAGSWQYQHQVLSAGKLSNEAIFARLFWLAISEKSDDSQQTVSSHKNSTRREKWQALMMIE